MLQTELQWSNCRWNNQVSIIFIGMGLRQYKWMHSDVHLIYKYINECVLYAFLYWSAGPIAMKFVTDRLDLWGDGGLI